MALDMHQTVTDIRWHSPMHFDSNFNHLLQGAIVMKCIPKYCAICGITLIFALCNEGPQQHLGIKQSP